MSFSVHVAFVSLCPMTAQRIMCWLIISSLVVEPAPSNIGTSMGKSCLSLSARCGGVSRLMVTPRVSGLERSQEKSLELHFPEPDSSSTSSASRPPSFSLVTASDMVSRPSPINSNSSRHNGSPPLSKHKSFLSLPGRSHIYNINNRYTPLIFIMNLTNIIYFPWLVLYFAKSKFDSCFIGFLSVFLGAALQSNLHRHLHLLHLPHPPCVPRLPPPVWRHPTSGVQDPLGHSGPHPEPALGRYTLPHLVCLPLHLCYKILPTQQQVQSAHRNTCFPYFYSLLVCFSCSWGTQWLMCY